MVWARRLCSSADNAIISLRQTMKRSTVHWYRAPACTSPPRSAGNVQKGWKKPKKVKVTGQLTGGTTRSTRSRQRCRLNPTHPGEGSLWQEGRDPAQRPHYGGFSLTKWAFMSLWLFRGNYLLLKKHNFPKFNY